jgi:hypothetical protein
MPGESNTRFPSQLDLRFSRRVFDDGQAHRMERAVPERGKRGIVRIGDHFPLAILDTQIEAALFLFEETIGDDIVGHHFERGLRGDRGRERDSKDKMEMRKSAHERLLLKAPFSEKRNFGSPAPFKVPAALRTLAWRDCLFGLAEPRSSQGSCLEGMLCFGSERTAKLLENGRTLKAASQTFQPMAKRVPLPGSSIGEKSPKRLGRFTQSRSAGRFHSIG